MLSLDFEKLADAANADDEFNITARCWDTRLQVGIDDQAAELLLINGRVVGVGKRGSFGNELRLVRMQAAEEDWAKLLQSCPPPGWHDLARANGFVLEGNILDRAPYYAALRRLIELMREQVSGPSNLPDVPDVDRKYDDAVGHYIYVNIQGVQYRIYYEDTGTGIPLVMQHTAGTDGAQWRHILEDEDYKRDFHLIAYDLPFHGKSLPPTSRKWWTERYMPTKAWLIDAIVTISGALELDRPVFMGCSIGGLLAPALAYERPDDFRAVIGVNGGFMSEAGGHSYGSNLGDPTDPTSSWFHPRIADDWRVAAMMGAVAPNSPPAYQREATWLYGQGAPGIFAGDGFSYGHEFDLSEEQARQIDTSKVAVYMLTGEYDRFARSGGTERLTECISGSKYVLINAAGHFAPSDNPSTFKRALDPVLKEIAAKWR